MQAVDSVGAIRGADVYFAAPGQSSVRYEADIAPEKTKVDVLVNGRAYSPSGTAVDRVPVSLRVGTLVKELVVTGDRSGRNSRPRPFVTMPIVYERAFGGAVDPDGRTAFQFNPVGVGYKGSRPRQQSIETAVPNVEYPDGRQAPAGFGAVSRQWRPRLELAGTYDNRWLESRCPLLPADFQLAYHQAAPVDQQLDSVVGGEIVELTNMTPESLWRFRIPILHVPVRLWYADAGDTATLRVDTMELEPDSYRVTLKARAKIPIVRNRAPLRQVIVGHVTRGWWTARVKRKMYLDWRQQNGRDVTASDFEA